MMLMYLQQWNSDLYSSL